MRITFQQVVRKERIKVQCRVCKRSLPRVMSVMHTVNPFNKDAAGLVKSRAQVYSDVSDALRDLVAKTKSDGIVCRGCHEETVHNSVPR
jgi:hypothetical protein